MTGLSERLETLNSRSGEEAALAVKAGKKASILRMLFLPPAVFILEYLLKANFIKGLDGLVKSVLAAYFVFVREVKIWELLMRG
jgi:hypothetical protein